MIYPFKQIQTLPKIGHDGVDVLESSAVLVLEGLAPGDPWGRDAGDLAVELDLRSLHRVRVYGEGHPFRGN